MCSLEVDAARSGYEYHPPEYSKFFSLLILLSLIQWSLLSMHNAYLVILPSCITILLLQCDASQHEPLRFPNLHMQDELCLQCYFIFYVDDDSECLTGHGPRSLSAVWAASATQAPISYLLCMERDRLGVHVSWTIGWTIFWDERHNMTTADVLSPVVLLGYYISQLLNEGQERQKQVVIVHQSTSRGSFLTGVK